MSHDFLRNTWYMAGWAAQLRERRMLTQTIIDVPLVVALSTDDEVFALHDRCPHRFAPLSRGKVTAQGLECGYHGLTFDPEGSCVANPLGDSIPQHARVQRFPVHIQDEIVWVWMGDPQRADHALIPALPCFHDPTLRFVFGVTEAAANYQLLADNLLDLTHAVFIHPGFGNPTDRPIFTLERDGHTVWAKYQVRAVPCPAFFEGFWDGAGQGQVDLWDDIRWTAPGVHYLESGIVAAGRPRSEGMVSPAAHILTPQSATQTTYFWASGIPKTSTVDDSEYREGLRQVFEHEDLPMIEAAQRRIGTQEFWAMKPLLLKNDGAAVSARRILQERIRDEQG